MAYTNTHRLPLPIVAWLANDEYDHDDNVVSVTSFIKPLREIILTSRIKQNASLLQRIGDNNQDVMNMLKSRLGTAMHSAIERTWKSEKLPEILMQIEGMSKKDVDRLVVNPTEEQLNVKGAIPIYVEHTMYKEHDGFTFRGTADCIFKGTLMDFKKTSVRSYTDPNKDYKYALQGSMYRWIDPVLITKDYMLIIEVYDDWTQGKANSPDYPPAPIIVKTIPLKDPAENEDYVNDKLDDLEDFDNAKDHKIPLCNDVELWRKGKEVWKYYSKSSSKRASKVLHSQEEADQYLASKNNVGYVQRIPDKVRACKYCDARFICQQYQQHLINGEIA